MAKKIKGNPMKQSKWRPAEMGGHELLPCPFCGGPARMKITPHIPTGIDYTPQCLDPSCCGRITKKWQERETAVYAWNRRATHGTE